VAATFQSVSVFRSSGRNEMSIQPTKILYLKLHTETYSRTSRT